MNPFALAFLSGNEWLAVLVIVVLLFGGAKIPELARSLGRAKAEYAKASKEGAEPTARPTSVEDEKILKAARDLGIPTEGRTLAEIRDDLRKRLA